MTDRFLRRLPLRGKLVLLCLAVCLGPLAVVGGLCYRQAAISLKAAAGRSLADLAFSTSDKLDRNLFERYGDVQAFAKSPAARSLDRARITEWMDTMMRTYTPIYDLMVVADVSGRIVAASTVDLAGRPLDTSVLIGASVKDESWFTVASSGSLPEGQSVVDDLHDDALMARVYGEGARSRALSFSYPIRDAEGRVVGVWSNRFHWGVATDIVEAVLARAQGSGARSATVTLFNRDGLVLVGSSPEDTLSRRLDSHLIQSARAKGAGGYGSERDEAGRAVLMKGYFRSAGYSTYEGLGWVVVTTQDESEALLAVRELFLVSMALTVLAALLVGLLGAYLASGITRPLVEAVAALEQSSGELRAQAQGQAAGAAEQAAAVAEVTATVEELSRTARQIAESAQRVSANAEENLATTSSARRAVEETKDGIESLREKVGALSSKILLLGDKAREIGRVVTLINEFAADTHLLALNASIEAAGAGDYGKRFAVVAGEVKRLAERVVAATAEIRSLIHDVQTSTNSAVMSAEDGAQEAERGSALALRSDMALAAIVGQVEATVTLAQEISLATGQQGQGSEQVARTMHDVSAIAQETATTSQHSTVSAESLIRIAQRLQRILGGSRKGAGTTGREAEARR